MAGKIPPLEKTQLHPRNKHRSLYDFRTLVKSNPSLSKYVSVNKYENESIDFADPSAVKELNKALLSHFYEINYWDIPEGYLCPPIPGRADYIHYISDLLASSNKGKAPAGDRITCLDIGVGANCVYPIIGNKEYGWSFVGSDIDPAAIDSASKIISSNPSLKDKISLRLQKNPAHIFKGVILKKEKFDLCICNPPFHTSEAEARKGSTRKVINLKTKKEGKVVLNFGGQNAELWCKGGEQEFVRNMITESAEIPDSCYWFSSLVSKSSHLPAIYHALKNAGAFEVHTIDMAQGNKISRIVAWTFLNKHQQREWALNRWNRTS